jgi:cystathionine gamma-lyase
MMSDDINMRAALLLHHSGGSRNKGEPLTAPIVQSSMFHLPGDPAGFNQYGRFDNPTWKAAEDALGHLEDAVSILFPSGMAAIASIFYALLKSGDRILLPSDGYYTPRSLANRFLAQMGIEADTCPTREMAAKAFDGYRIVFVETPSNPGLDVCDISLIAKRTALAGAILVVDNTTMTPLGQRPLDLGADIVVSADTKAMNGHSDILAGHVASRNETLLAAIADWRKIGGAIPGGHDAWLLLRGLSTLEVRFERMCDTAQAIAARLADRHPEIRVRYPGLAGDPSKEIAGRQMRRSGFLIGMTLPSAKAAEQFIDDCPLIEAATSFGGVHSSAERRARWGDDVDPGFVRLSVGCEPAEALWAAIEKALPGSA